jgi:hypothetical protein
VRRGRPKYPPEEVASLARQRGNVWFPRTVNDWLSEHERERDVAETVSDILQSIPRHGRYQKTMPLHEGQLADVYTVPYDGIDWYVKLYVEEEALVVVMTCCWIGAAH